VSSVEKGNVEKCTQLANSLSQRKTVFRTVLSYVRGKIKSWSVIHMNSARTFLTLGDDDDQLVVKIMLVAQTKYVYLQVVQFGNYCSSSDALVSS